MTAIGTARIAKIDAWVWRRTWKPTAGTMPAWLHASRIGRSCSARFHLPSSRRKIGSSFVRPAARTVNSRHFLRQRSTRPSDAARCRRVWQQVPWTIPRREDRGPRAGCGRSAKRNESSKVRPAHVAVLSLTRCQVNAVRAAFKAGIAPPELRGTPRSAADLPKRMRRLRRLGRGGPIARSRRAELLLERYRRRHRADDLREFSVRSSGQCRRRPRSQSPHRRTCAARMHPAGRPEDRPRFAASLAEPG